MEATFAVLASGSAGNAAWLQTPALRVLIDFGLGPRQLAMRLAEHGSARDDIDAVLVTHTHRDHWHPRTLEWLCDRPITLCCHSAHLEFWRRECPAIERLVQARRVQTYSAGTRLELGTGVSVLPLPVSHDGGPTFAFRVDLSTAESVRCRSLGYAADLGTWNRALAEALRDVDLLALEFNHDVDPQRTSGRDPWLIARVLGDHGHLSNLQAEQFLQAILERSSPGRLQQVVPLHLSRDCNRPDLAQAAAERALQQTGRHVPVVPALQHESTPAFRFAPAALPQPPFATSRVRSGGVSRTLPFDDRLC